MIKLILFAITLAAGQLLFKKVAANLAGTESGIALVFRIALDPAFVLAITLYFAATLLWVTALREIPLSRAYPFTALAFVLVPVGAMLFFGETLGSRYFLGLAIIMLGMFLVSEAAPAPAADRFLPASAK